jgi:hypothetical protein
VQRRRLAERARTLIHHCEQPGAFLLKELRGKPVYFLEPGTIRVHTESAEEAIRSGWLVPRDFDLLGAPMTWIAPPR